MREELEKRTRQMRRSNYKNIKPIRGGLGEFNSPKKIKNKKEKKKNKII